MCHVAAEMERHGFDVPLLIGGATTSRVHTAVKIHPNYKRGQTVYVTDASRAAGVVTALMSKEGRSRTFADTRAEYEKIATAHARAQQDKARLPLATARANALKLDWSTYRPVRPSFLGTRRFTDYPLAELVDYIDWSPFFSTWDLTGNSRRSSRTRRSARRRARSTPTRARCLDQIVREGWLRASAVAGFWPAKRGRRRYPALCLRMPQDAARDAAHPASADGAARSAAHQCGAGRFRRAAGLGLTDYVGGFAVTAGLGEEEAAARFTRANDDYSSIMLKALADRLAEAFAERLHQRVRRNCGATRPTRR